MPRHRVPSEVSLPKGTTRPSSRVVLISPPGGGKSRQGRALAAALGVPHLSLGNLLRAEAAAGTELGQRVQPFLEAGELAPDELVTAVVIHRLGEPDVGPGFVLDGFPRTAAQARALDRILGDRAIDAIVHLRVPEVELIRRLRGRRICPQGHTYHLEIDPPRIPGQCDEDGLPLRARPDDRPDAITKRLRVYRESTAPLLADYRERTLLVEVDGIGNVEEVARRIVRTLCE